MHLSSPSSRFFSQKDEKKRNKFSAVLIQQPRYPASCNTPKISFHRNVHPCPESLVQRSPFIVTSEAIKAPPRAENWQVAKNRVSGLPGATIGAQRSAHRAREFPQPCVEARAVTLDSCGIHWATTASYFRDGIRKSDWWTGARDKVRKEERARRGERFTVVDTKNIVNSCYRRHYRYSYRRRCASPSLTLFLLLFRLRPSLTPAPVASVNARLKYETT